MITRNMKLGNREIYFIIFFFLLSSSFSLAEEKIISSPLINLEKLKPSFEEIEETTNEETSSEFLRNKKKSPNETTSTALLIGLDKITAKTSRIKVKIGQTEKFGPLEIKVLKCGKMNLENTDSSVAYLQVKDLSKNNSEKVFIFNGWTFSSDATIAPFDHAIYDLQLVNCNKA